MRAFIAIEFPGHIRDALSELQKELRLVTDTARWVAPESIHITLKFIGELAESGIEEVDKILAGLRWKPFTVKVRSVGFFPGSRSPRVFWAGMEAPAMAALAVELDARLERIGIEKENRAFRGHITLARARESRMDPSLVAAAKQYENHEFGSFAVNRFFLFQSTLRPEGAIYNKLKEYPLEPQPR